MQTPIDMNLGRTAYVVLFLDITGPQPVAVSAGIRSSDAGSLVDPQCDHARHTVIDIMHAPGSDYADAERNAREYIARHPAYAWVRPLIDRSLEAPAEMKVDAMSPCVKIERPWLREDEPANTVELGNISREIRTRAAGHERALDLAGRLLDIIDDLDKLHRTAPSAHRLPAGWADRQVQRIRAAPPEMVIEWLAHDAAAWHAGDTNLDVGYVAGAYMEVLQTHIGVRAEGGTRFGRLTTGELVQRVSPAFARTQVREAVAELVEYIIRETNFPDDLKVAMEASLVDVIADRTAGLLPVLEVAARGVSATVWPDWQRPGWILSARTRRALKEAAADKDLVIHDAVSKALAAWDDYGDLSEITRAELAAWAQDYQASSNACLRTWACGIVEFLTALYTRAAFLCSVTSGPVVDEDAWTAQHSVQIDLSVLRRACEAVIQHRPRDASPPHVTISADVLLAVVEFAQVIRASLQAGPGKQNQEALVGLAVRGPVVSGSGTPDAEGSVVQPASHRSSPIWTEPEGSPLDDVELS